MRYRLTERRVRKCRQKVDRAAVARRRRLAAVPVNGRSEASPEGLAEVRAIIARELGWI